MSVINDSSIHYYRFRCLKGCAVLVTLPQPLLNPTVFPQYTLPNHPFHLAPKISGHLIALDTLLLLSLLKNKRVIACGTIAVVTSSQPLICLPVGYSDDYTNANI